jgi:malonate-semialdehyde dehydrogenase (acetylating)/methylmalonate-semialdehyde dehydrogenase
MSEIKHRLQNYVNGRWVEATAARHEPVPNPATGEILAWVPLSGAADARAAVAAARAAFPSWSAVPVPKRARLLFRFHQLLVDHWDELARLIVTENGKSYDDAHGEVLRAIECVEFAAGAPTLMMGRQLAEIATNLESGTYRYPLGVVVGITPFNFPMMVPCWMFPLAVACGNTFVLKPSERTPLTAVRLAELVAEAGFPPGVFNIVHGAHEAVNALIADPEVKAVSFVGSQPVAEHVYRTAAGYGKRVQALAGAKNHSIVMPDADLDDAARQITSAAFGSAGERCMAASVVVAVGEAAEPLVRKLREAADRIVIGNGLDRGVFLGPVIRDSQKAKMVEYIEAGIAEGAELVRDGRRDEAFTREGYFIGPTLFDRVTPEMSIWKKELFGPILSIVRAETLEEAIDIANRSEFANAACLYTKSGIHARLFRERIEAGMIGINVGVPAPTAFFPFSGYKKSFYGDLHANGEDGVRFYTRQKTVTAKW